MGSHSWAYAKILVLHTVEVYGVDFISQRSITYLLKSCPSVQSIKLFFRRSEMIKTYE